MILDKFDAVELILIKASHIPHGFEACSDLRFTGQVLPTQP